MLRTLAALKAAKKNAPFAPSSTTHTGVGTAGLPHRSGSNFFSGAKYWALLCVILLKFFIYLVATNTFILSNKMLLSISSILLSFLNTDPTLH